MLGLLGALLVAGGLVGWLAARSVMARINRINDLADRVAEPLDAACRASALTTNSACSKPMSTRCSTGSRT